jgi:hypothetical protein
MRRHSSTAADFALDEQIPSATLDELDEAIAEASRGDNHAIACLALAFGRSLWAEAMSATQGDRSRATDVMQELYLSLLEGTRPFDPAFDGRALPWIRRQIQAIAAAQRS